MYNLEQAQRRLTALEPAHEPSHKSAYNPFDDRCIGSTRYVIVMARGCFNDIHVHVACNANNSVPLLILEPKSIIAISK